MDVLVVHAGFGEGHKKAARAIADAIGAKECDLLDFSSPFIKRIYSASYLFTTQYFPYLWQTAFASTKSDFFSSWLNRLHRRTFSSLFTYLRKHKPKIIITTHFFASNLLGFIKYELNFKAISIITDLRVHPLWVNKCIDYYFVALDTTKRDLIKLGVRGDRITTGFVPVRKGFLKKLSEQELQKKFYLRARPSIMFVSSLRGRFPFFKKSVKSLLKNFNIFVIYGRNKKLRRYLESIGSPYIRFFSFYDEIWDLVSLSFVIIAKPGGLTVFEGIYKRKPFIFTHYIPGQEKENMDLLISYGVAKFVRNEDELIAAINYFKNKQDQLKEKYPLEVKNIKEPLQNLIQTCLAADNN